MDISAENTYKREIAALQKGASDLKCNDLTLLTLSDTRPLNSETPSIRIIPVIDWLLEETRNDIR